MATKTPIIEKKERKASESPAPKGTYLYAVGRRKTAVAQVRLYPDKGNDSHVVNRKGYAEYFPVSLQPVLVAPLAALGLSGDFVVSATVKGGGVNAQAEAIRQSGRFHRSVRHMRGDNYSFWMGGKNATSLVEVSSDLARLEDGNFWAVSISFEGVVRLARFADVTDEEFAADDEGESGQGAQWVSSMDKDAYCNYVSAVRSAIGDGVVYQANACRILSRPFEGDDLTSLFDRILRENPAPYASYLSIPEHLKHQRQ